MGNTKHIPDSSGISGNNNSPRTFTFNTTQWVQRIISGKKTKQNRILDPIYEFMIKYMNFIFNVIKCISTKASWYPCRSVGHIKQLNYLLVTLSNNINIEKLNKLIMELGHWGHIGILRPKIFLNNVDIFQKVSALPNILLSDFWILDKSSSHRKKCIKM